MRARPRARATRGFGLVSASAAALLGLGAPRGARADEPSAAASSRDVSELTEAPLEELLSTPIEVWSATKIESKAEEVAAIVSVYTRDDIRRFGYGSIAELLTHELGFYVVDDHAIPNVAVRGVSGGLWSESGVIKVMVDGHSVSFRSTGGNFLGPELIPLSAVDRVEILRGPGSSLYGADAFLGVINIVTRDGESLSGAELSAEVNVTGENFGDGQDVALGTRVGPANLFLSYRHHHRDLSGLKLPESSPAPHLPAHRAPYEEATGLVQESHVGYASLRYQVGRSAITLSGYASVVDREAAFSPWLQLANGVDPAGRRNQNHLSLAHGHFAVKVETPLTSGTDLTVDATFFRGTPTDRDHIDVGSDLYFVRREFGFVGIDSNAELRLRISDDVTGIAGVGILADRESLPSTLYVLKAQSGRLPAASVVDSISTRQGTRDFINPSVYALAVWSPLKAKLRLTGGLRGDYHNVYESQLSGRLGVVTSPVDGLHIKVLYGGAFKAPSPLLLYGVPLHSGDIIGNAGLKPQYVHTIEGQVSYKPVRRVTLSTGVAYNYLLNKAEFTQQGVNKIARNLSEVGSLSWETSARLLYSPWVDAYGSFELNTATRNLGRTGYQFRLAGSDNVIYPPVMAHAGVLAGAPELPLRVGVEGSYIGARRSSDDNSLEAGAPYKLDPYYMLGAVVSTTGLHLFDDNRETVISAVGRNLTGTSAADPGFAGVDYPRAQRSFVLQLRQEL